MFRSWQDLSKELKGLSSRKEKYKYSSNARVSIKENIKLPQLADDRGQREVEEIEAESNLLD
jgi:hypothetical protein